MCFTLQLKSLQTLNQRYRSRGLIVLGVPSNDFGGQTPQENKEVKNFCKDSYGVDFLLTTKMVVSGVQKHGLFQYLTKSGGDIGWNFEKFLVDKKGFLKERFRSGKDPLAKDFIKSLEKLF